MCPAAKSVTLPPAGTAWPEHVADEVDEEQQQHAQLMPAGSSSSSGSANGSCSAGGGAADASDGASGHGVEGRNGNGRSGRPLLERIGSQAKKQLAALPEISVKIEQTVKRPVERIASQLKRTATPEAAKAVAKNVYMGFQSDVAVSAHAAHDMLILWLWPGFVKNLELEAQHAHWSVRWNPAYWAMYLPLIACILPGKWLHSLWGQGGPMRPDETIEESRVRLHWIYCLDGPIVGAALLDLLDVLIDLPGYTQRKFTEGAISYVMTLLVTGTYVLVNSYFLDVMRRRSLVGIRLVIVWQTVFGVGLLNLLVAGLYRNKTEHVNGDYFFSSWLALASFATRFTMVCFMLAAAFVYSRLWNAYKHQRQPIPEVSFYKHGDYMRRECLQYSTLPLTAIGMWVLLGLAAMLDDDIFWDAFV